MKFYDKAVEQQLAFPGVVLSPHTKTNTYIDEIIKIEQMLKNDINTEKRRSEIKEALFEVGNQEDKRVEYLINLIRGPESLIHKELGSDIQVPPVLQGLLNKGARYDTIKDIKDSVIRNLEQNYKFQNVENPDINVATVSNAITHALEAFATNISDLKGKKRDKLEKELTDVIYSISSYTWKGLATGETYMKEGNVYNLAEKIADIVENHVSLSNKVEVSNQKRVQTSQKNNPQEVQHSDKRDKNFARSSTLTKKHVSKSDSFLKKERERSQSVDCIKR